MSLYQQRTISFMIDLFVSPFLQYIFRQHFELIFLNIKLGPFMTSSPRRRSHGLHNSDSSCQIQCSWLAEVRTFIYNITRLTPQNCLWSWERFPRQWQALNEHVHLCFMFDKSYRILMRSGDIVFQVWSDINQRLIGNLLEICFLISITITFWRRQSVLTCIYNCFIISQYFLKFDLSFVNPSW